MLEGLCASQVGGKCCFDNDRRPAMATQWFCNVNGKQLGPMSAQQLLTMARSGELAHGDRVRKGQAGSWVLAKQVTGLFDASDPPVTELISRRQLAQDRLDDQAQADDSARSISEDEIIAILQQPTIQTSAPRTPPSAMPRKSEPSAASSRKSTVSEIGSTQSISHPIIARSRERAMQLNDMAALLAQKGEAEQAASFFKEAIEVDPTWSVPYFNYARFLYLQKNYKESARYGELAKKAPLSRLDPTNDGRVLKDIELLEGSLSAHGVGKGTPRQFFSALAAARGENVNKLAPEPNEASTLQCKYCQSKITRKAPVHMLLPVKELKGASKTEIDRWYKSLGQQCPTCRNVCCGNCYSQNKQKCPDCGATLNFFSA